MSELNIILEKINERFNTDFQSGFHLKAALWNLMKSKSISSRHNYRRAKPIYFAREIQKNIIDKEKFLKVNSRKIKEIKDFFDKPTLRKRLFVDQSILRIIINSEIVIQDNSQYRLLLLTNDGNTTIIRKPSDISVISMQFSEEEQGSDAKSIESIYNDQLDGTLHWKKRIISKERSNRGSYFPFYSNIVDLDLSDYGVYTKEKHPNQSEIVHCFEKAILQAVNSTQHGDTLEEKPIVSLEEYRKITTLLSPGHISYKDIEIIAKNLNVYIKIKTIKNDQVRTWPLKAPSYVNENTPIIELGCLANHYFIIKQTDISSAYLEHYFDMPEKYKKKHSISYKITRKNPYVNDKEVKKLNSFEVIAKLLTLVGYFIKDEQNRIIINDNFKECISAINGNQHLEMITLKNAQKGDFYSNVNFVNGYVDLKYDNVCVREVMNQEDYKQSSKVKWGVNNFVDVIYFDTETTTDRKKHEAYLICASSKILGKISYNRIEHGEDFINKFFRHIKDGLILHQTICKQSLQPNEHLKDIDKQTVVGKVLFIAHNLLYDFSQINSSLTSIRDNPIKKGNSLKTVIGYFEKMHCVFKDSLAFIANKLSEFPKMFNLGDIKKEVFPYEFYDSNLIKKPQFISTKGALKYLNDNDQKEFLKLLQDTDCLIATKRPPSKKTKFDKFDWLKYSKYYCERDVEVLEKGFETFRDQIKEISGMEIYNMVSSPGFGYEFCKKEKVLDDCYELSHHVRDFISQTIIGGRVMCRKNRRSILKGNIQDFDGISLYPSAMNRLQRELGGYLKGKPKVIDVVNFQNILDGKKMGTIDAYFVEIELIPNYPLTLASKMSSFKCPIKRDFPILSAHLNDNVRNFSNIFNNVNGINNLIHVVDHITLEELMKYQGVTLDDFKVIKGYYFDEGRNPLIGNFIRDLFNKRKQAKKERNAIEKTYKLIMNSCYGRLGLKPITHNYKFVEGKKIKKFVESNWHIIDEYSQINGNYKYGKEMSEEGRYIVKVKKPINNHFSMPHLSSEILAMSKRIMNEVMYTAEDNGIKIAYQDTDSMHIKEKDVEKLRLVFNEKYGRELIGSEMGQFHCDFDDTINAVMSSDDEDDDDDDDVMASKMSDENTQTSMQSIQISKADHVRSVKAIFLGKKSYIDRLELTVYERDIDPLDPTRSIITDRVKKKYSQYHVRMKGIPESILIDKANEAFGGDLMQLYEHLFKGNEIEVDIAKVAKFEFCKNFSYQTRKKFMRKMHFPKSN